jgi:uncharacterized membrane protein YkoI
LRPAGAGRRRPSRRALACAIAALALLGGLVTAVTRGDDDRPVDPTTPAARRAIAVALGVVPGRVVGVAIDQDNGKWEVTIAQEGREYEVELDPRDLTLLRLDYD